MTCPTCGQTIDALRAPVARVVGGRVVSYCSLDCKEGRDHTPLPAPSVPETDTIDVDADNDRDAAPLPEGDLTPVPAGGSAPSLISAPVVVPRPRRVRFVLGAAAVVALAGIGGGTLIMRRSPVSAAVVAPDPKPAAAAVTPPVAEPAPPAEPPRAIDREHLLGEARTALGEALKDPSSRVRLLAAKALSRTGDAAALKELDAALENDPSEIRRLEVAYALARAGQDRGRDYLVAGLKSGRRDVRLEAARALALLKDNRGADRLREALGAVQLRLSAAESLAALGDKEGIEVLREALAGKVDEIRMRAAVALGRAGDDAGRELLLSLIADARPEVGAEDALAHLGNQEAVPALTRALGLSALRVQAAVDLRRLRAEGDLGVLARAFETSDEFGRISAAEALLVLLLPEPPAELK